MATETQVFFVTLLVACASADLLSFNHGVLEAKNGTTEGSICIVYYPNITTFPTEKTDPIYHQIVDFSYWDGCSAPHSNMFPYLPQIGGKYIILRNGNCSLMKRSQQVESLGAKGLLIVLAHVVDLYDNETYPQTIPVALIGQTSKDILVGLGSNVEVFIYAPVDGSHMDYSLVVIWFLAVVTVGIGAYWSGLIRHELQKQSNSPPVETSGDLSADGKAGALQEEVSLSVTPVLVGVFVLCMCGMLVLLYYFFAHLVYVIIGIFLLASTTAVYQCLEPLVLRVPIGSTKFSINTRCLQAEVEVRQIVLFLAAVSLSGCWAAYRKARFAWILQDILGFAFSVNMLRLVRLPSLKICTLLLVLLFFYDIFFVFITPLLTKNGQSVMVEVATGGSSSQPVGTGGSGSSSAEEQLPMVVRVPHLGYDPLDVCWQRYSLLGFGDILVPGMLVAFCHGFDLARANRVKLYYITTLLAYALGLLMTFAGLHLMAMAQPALLYLVPFTLIPVFLLGLKRREWRQLWRGDTQVGEITRLTDARMETGVDFGGADGDAPATVPAAAGSIDRHSLLVGQQPQQQQQQQQQQQHTADDLKFQENGSNLFYQNG